MLNKGILCKENKVLKVDSNMNLSSIYVSVR